MRDQPLGVLGTGPGSVEHAHLLRQWSDDVVFFTHATTCPDAERAALDARGIAVVDGTVERLVVEGDRLRAVRLADGRTVARAALFIRPGAGRPPRRARRRRSAAIGSRAASCASTPTAARASPACGRPATPPTRGRR